MPGDVFCIDNVIQDGINLAHLDIETRIETITDDDELFLSSDSLAKNSKTNTSTTEAHIHKHPAHWSAKFLYIGPFSVASREAADMAMSLYQGNYNSPITLAFAGVAAFTASISLTAEPATKNAHTLTNIIKKRSIPEKWPTISANRERFAVGTSTLLATWGITSASIQAYFFMVGMASDYQFIPYHLPWKIFSGAIAAGTGVTTFFTDSFQAYKELRQLLAHQKHEYTNAVSAIMSPIIGGFFGGLKSLDDAVQAYVTISSVLNIKGTPWTWGLGSLCVMNMIPDFCFAGMFGITSLDTFIANLADKNFTVVNTVAFIQSFAISIGLAFFEKPLNEDFYTILADDLDWEDYNFINTLIEALVITIFLQKTFILTAELYKPMSRLVTGISNKLVSTYGAITQLCHRKPPEPESIDLRPLLQENDDDEQDDGLFSTPTPPAPRQFHGAHLFFNRHQTTQTQAQPKKRFECGIM